MYRAHPEKRHEPIQTHTTLDQLVPKDHLVRKLDRHIDFSIVHRLCAPLYSNTGTPGTDPEIIIKIIQAYRRRFGGEEWHVPQGELHLSAGGGCLSLPGAAAPAL